MKLEYSLRPGSLVVVGLPHRIAYHVAEVLTERPLSVKVAEFGELKELRTQGVDFYLLEEDTMLIQMDQVRNTQLFLTKEQEAGAPVFSGLFRMGAEEGVVQRIYPMY